MSESSVVKILGGTKVLGKRVTGRLALADLIEAGLPTTSLELVKKALGMTYEEVAHSLGVSQKTVSRFRKISKRPLGAAASDRLYRIAHLYALALEVFEDEDSAREWLRTPQIGINNRVPLQLVGTEAGFQEVEHLLGRIEHGVFS